MFKFTTDKKDTNSFSQESEAHDGKTLVSEVSDMRKELDEQIKEMKELSSVTIAAIGKVSNLNADKIDTRLSSIDERLKKFDEHTVWVDKKLADLERLSKKDSQAVGYMHEDYNTAEGRASSISHCSSVKDKVEVEDIKMHDIPFNEARHHDVNDSPAHVIETTMDKADAKINDEVSETIMSYENRKIVKPEEPKGNVFTKLMSKMKPSHKKKSLAQPKMAVLEDKGILHDNLTNEFTKNDLVPTIPDQAPEMTALDKPAKVEAAEQPIMEEKSTIAKKADVSLIGVDEGDLRPKMDEMLSQANQMIVEKRYSDATEVYLKLSDAYERNKNNPVVQELRVNIDELYDKISSILLSNLVGADTGKNMSIFDQNR